MLHELLVNLSGFGDIAHQKKRSAVWDGVAGIWVWEDTYFDGMGRVYEHLGITGLTRETRYGDGGQASKVSHPYLSAETVRWTEKVYDSMGRVTSETGPDGSTVSTSYDDDSVFVTDSLNNVAGVWTDAYGNKVKTRITMGGQYKYTYYYSYLGTSIPTSVE